MSESEHGLPVMTGVDYGQLIWHVCLSLNTDRTDDWEDYCQLVTDGTPHLLLALAYVPVLLSAVGVMIAVHSPSVRSTAQTPHRQLSLDTLPPPSFLSCPTVNLIAESLQAPPHRACRQLTSIRVTFV